MKYAGVTQLCDEDVQRNIRAAESMGNYNCETQLPDWSRMQKVTEKFVFLPKNPLFLIWSAVARFTVAAVDGIVCALLIGGKVRGRENLRGIKNAVLVCNHVHNLDNLLVRYAAAGHRLYITVAEFNNMTGFLGSFMRAGGILPFSDNFSAMKNLSRAVSTVLKKRRNVVLYYPEKSMWPYYEKPRPFLDGAFHTAAANSVPVVPMFIVWKDPGKFRRLFSKKKTAELHILKAVRAKETLSRRENIQYLKNESFDAMCRCYREHFGHECDTRGAKVVTEEPFDKGYEAFLAQREAARSAGL